MTRRRASAHLAPLATAALLAACGGARASTGGVPAAAPPAPADDRGTPATRPAPGDTGAVGREAASPRSGTWTVGATACPASAAGREPGAAPDTTAPARAGASPRASNDRPDVLILAAATAREVRFAAPPDVRVRLCGGGDAVRVVERRNLPERIVPGTTYRDVHVAVEILGHVDVGCADSTTAARIGTTCVRFSIADSAGARRRAP